MGQRHINDKMSETEAERKEFNGGRNCWGKQFLPNMIWSRMFLEAQGYKLNDNILYQDNQSAMKIIMNGKKSSRQKTKHMDNRYFWIKDRLQSKEI